MSPRILTREASHPKAKKHQKDSGTRAAHCKEIRAKEAAIEGRRALSEVPARGIVASPASVTMEVTCQVMCGSVVLPDVWECVVSGSSRDLLRSGSPASRAEAYARPLRQNGIKRVD
jgi:hypothetical protein